MQTSYDYTITMNNIKKKHSTFRELNGLLFVKLESLSHKNWPSGFGYKKIFKICQCIFAFSLLSPLQTGCGPSSPFHSRMLCAKFGWNWPSGSWEEDFKKFCQSILIIFVIISPLKRVWSFIWINFNPLYPKMHCAKISWNWPSGSGEEVEKKEKFTD